MSALVTYLKQITAAEEDGTVCLTLSSNDIGTLTIRNKSIVAATVGERTGNKAVSIIKVADIVHMKFWKGITTRRDVKRMVRLNIEIGSIAPIEEMHPEGVDITDSSVFDSSTIDSTVNFEYGDDSENRTPVSDSPQEQHIEPSTPIYSSDNDEDDNLQDESPSSANIAENAASTPTNENKTYSLSEENHQTIEQYLIRRLGPVAEIVIDDALARATSDTEFVALISKDLYSENEVQAFTILTNDLFNLYIDIGE